MSNRSTCPPNSDNQRGPRVNIGCREFDFTLLFEDVFFIALPSMLFLLTLVVRLPTLSRASLKLESSRLAMCKLAILGILFVFQLTYTIYQSTTPVLYTNFALPSAIFSIIATFASIVVSYLEDQRSIQPSTLLLLYFSNTVILSISRLRTLWLISPSSTATIIWTWAYAFMVLALFAESVEKRKWLAASFKHATQEEISGLWSKSLFLWTWPSLRLGSSTIFSLSQIPEVDSTLQGASTHYKLSSTWDIFSKRHERYAMLLSTFRAFCWPFCSAIIPRLCLSAFTFSQPFLISATVKLFDTSSTRETKPYGPALIGAYLLVYVGIAVSTAIYWRQTFRFVTMVRGGLVAMIYRQTTLLKAEDLKDSAAMTLMSTDVERIVTSLRFIHETWGSLLDVAVAIWLLSRQLFLACLVPAIICLVSILAMARLAPSTKDSQKQWVQKVEERIHVTSKMLENIKAVKILGLTPIISSLVESLRAREITTSRRLRKILVWQEFFSTSPQYFAAFATFGIYVIIAEHTKDSGLFSAKTFTALSLISLLTSPLLMFTQVVPEVVQCFGCFQRIESYCRISQVSEIQNTSGESCTGLPTDPGSEQLELVSRQAEQTLITFSNASFSWSRRSKTVLHDINLAIRNAEITMIVGPVGSGKSALVESILGETILLDGDIAPCYSRIAYCSQIPWLQNDTIRNNIIGAADFEQDWYKRVLWLCALEEDLTQIPYGDLLEIGTNGITLSGGQKHRIALARAIYSRAKVVLLDDVLSGLDSRNLSTIAERLLGPGGYFRENGHSVILATHMRRVLPYSDTVIVLENGRVVSIGSHAQLQIDSTSISDDKSLPTEPDSRSKDISQEYIEVRKKSLQFESSEQSKREEDETTVDISRQSGDWSVYRYYFEKAGYKLSFLTAISMLLSAFASNFSTLWLQWWSDANSGSFSNRNGMYLGVYGLISITAAASFLTACWLLLINIINSTAMRLHKDLLETAVRAPFSFFRRTDTGLITNRFSQDMDLIDMNLPLIAISFVQGLGDCLVKVIIICVVSKYFAAAVPLLGITVYVVQLYYLRTSRQVRLLDIEARAPLFTHFLETINGVVAIRAFGWSSSFQMRAYRLLNNAQNPFYLLFCIQQWLTLVLNFITGLVAVVLVAITISEKSKFSPGAIGVILNMILTFNQSLTFLIKAWALLETSIGAVTRVKQFVAKTPSEKQMRQTSLTPPDWPSRGKIEVLSVSVCSEPQQSPILNNISISINPGEKIAICGPSGSGKSSLILSLFQMVDLQHGRILIDDRDISEMNCEEIRSRMNVIPQEPFFMPGTIRFNLDPRQAATDEDIQIAIQKVGLWDRIMDDGGLPADFSASDWSVGELQLLSLARALVSKSAIVILDEATSSVDQETEALMQEIIEREFKHQTVIAVVHRLRFIRRFDRVVLLRHGELCECDTPDVLLGKPSEFRKFYEALAMS